MNGGYIKRDGTRIDIGIWLQTDDGVGQFIGMWEHPTLGWMAGLKLFRYFARPSTTTDIYFMMSKESGLAALERTIVVAGPLRRNGKRPLPISIDQLVYVTKPRKERG